MLHFGKFAIVHFLGIRVFRKNDLTKSGHPT
jgi:hypothetical protein